MWFWFRLAGPGSAEAGIGDDVGHAIITASYLSDALGDLLHALWLCGSGAPEARCSWQEEPGEFRWVCRRQGDDIQLRILAFDDYYRHRPDAEGAVVFETRQDWEVVTRAIALGASRAVEKHGEAEYRNEWGHPFPTATLALIRAQLRAASTGSGG